MRRRSRLAIRPPVAYNSIGRLLAGVILMRRTPLLVLLPALTALAIGGCGVSLRATHAPADTVYTRGVVAADHFIASRAGLEMLERGGNAVDAAVAASFCLAVVRPYSCGLGGGGFMVVHLAAEEPMPARNIAITYRETAPGGLHPEYYVQLESPDASRTGPHAVGVPGTVAGLLYALENYGTLDRATVLRPATRAAEEGFAIDGDYVAAAREVLDDLAEHPDWPDLIGRERFEWFHRRFLFNGEPKVGQVLRQPELGRTLRLLARDGEAAFYTGPLAHAIADACPAMTPGDLARYEPRTSRPLTGTFGDRTIIAMPLPSSGGIAMLASLGLLERRRGDLDSTTSNSAGYVHLVVEAMKHAFADRAQWLGDDRFVDVPVATLLSDEYLDDLASRIDPQRTQPPDRYGSGVQLPEDGGTSHLSAVDRWGNAVACTETINLEFGSLTAIPEFGLLLNNEMDDFLTIPGQRNAFGLEQSERNLPQPGKWPLSSMSPTIVLDSEGRVEIVVGGSGGPRIISSSLQAMLNVVLFDESAHEAVASPRFHHQWMPDVLQFEDGWEDVQAIEALRVVGHKVGQREDIGVVQLIRRTDGGYRAASDPRKGGAPAGP